MLEINEYRCYEPEVFRVQLPATAGIFICLLAENKVFSFILEKVNILPSVFV